MFTKKSNSEATQLDKAIADVFNEMEGFTADQQQYAQMVDQLEKLYKLKQIDKPEKFSKEAIVGIVGNLLGIAAILSFEQTHSLGTKALGFVIKPRV